MTAQVRLIGARHNGRTRRDARPIGPLAPMPSKRIPVSLIALVMGCLVIVGVFLR